MTGAASGIELVTGDALRHELAPVAALLAAAYPPQAIRMDRAYLEWILDALSDEHPAAAALARRGGELAGFAGAAPAAFECAGATAPGWIVSWVAVHPRARGGRLAVRLYQRLLAHLAERGAGVIHTFAQADTTGAALIEACYPSAGWQGQELAPLNGWGALRRRIRAIPDAGSGSALGAPTLTADRLFRERLARDPRQVALSTNGEARLVVVTFNDPDLEPVGAIEFLAPDPAPGMLAEFAHAAVRLLPEAISRIVIPSLPPSVEQAAAGLGFRRLPAPAWRNWVFSRDPAHPLLRATRTAIPVI